MALIKTSYGRRSFLKTSAMAGGGLVVGFSWLASCNPSPKEVAEMPKEWFEINGYLKIGDNGMATIMSPNPEIGQNVKTSMPMIVAEELDIDWNNVLVEQAPLNTTIFIRQLAGGSQSIRQGWDGLRMAGATARHMLKQAAAKQWEVPVEEVTTEAGVIHHKSSNRSVGYGEVASLAATLTAPEEVELKSLDEFKIIGTATRNVDGKKIVTGKPLFGIDQYEEGMLTAMIVHPPAFGLTLKSFDDAEARKMPGIKDVFSIKTYEKGKAKSMFDADAFPELIVVVGNSTWEVMNAKKTIKAEWQPFEGYEEEFANFSGDGSFSVKVPGGMENTNSHKEKMEALSAKLAKEARKDGNPASAFKKAAKIVERSYTAPFLAHNTMEPMNFFANVTADKAILSGPIQTPEFMEKSVSSRIGLPLDKIEIQMTRQGGGFGRRLYGHFVVEAAVISQKMKAPVKLVYTREDDMSFGNYRPAYHARYRAALDEDNNLIGFHVRAGGIPESPLFANRFPAGAVENYLAESWDVPSNISVGAFRAPRSNFIAGAEQSFLDEVAEAAGKDPIEFRIELFEKAKNNPVGENNDYDAERYAGVLKLAREKSGWNGNTTGNVYRGVSAYYCHNSYVANILDMEMKEDKPVVKKVFCAVDCGLVVNPIAATNMVEGGTVDGIGHAMYSGLTFKDGKPEQVNFDRYRLIRHSEAPKDIEVHFVKNNEHPTGLGEPPFPPIMGALANALYKATGQRHYDQPFITKRPVVS
ncbi:xanthine dehydrogenase family protein molybdopterin-binding subunit [Galbibacter pacificus]|uniref:Molybdopterin-dependent oxidoreductase n=1 Tax=Galbibacter pacificus TaxID=2996052 RepID=A0ABT6FR29_9FLAO|nr:molybdopterin cofactor-binding domain-containing protein [Galbibacter pacificus]MDG3582007.1 molybdopterin-dependent oxidoreductase [Galbibacter pacificus]MDG3585519.1 molybdopterin-dependent oxidoreductase [Galbibacter pacificus]